jgi:hypothetical protein
MLSKGKAVTTNIVSIDNFPGFLLPINMPAHIGGQIYLNRSPSSEYHPIYKLFSAQINFAKLILSNDFLLSTQNYILETYIISVTKYSNQSLCAKSFPNIRNSLYYLQIILLLVRNSSIYLLNYIYVNLI